MPSIILSVLKSVHNYLLPNTLENIVTAKGIFFQSEESSFGRQLLARYITWNYGEALLALVHCCSVILWNISHKI